MPKPTNNDQFFSDWYDHKLEMAAYMAKAETKQEQTEKELSELTKQSEKNKKFRYTVATIGSTTTLGTIYAAVKVFFGQGS